MPSFEEAFVDQRLCGNSGSGCLYEECHTSLNGKTFTICRPTSMFCILCVCVWDSSNEATNKQLLLSTVKGKGPALERCFSLFPISTVLCKWSTSSSRDSADWMNVNSLWSSSAAAIFKPSYYLNIRGGRIDLKWFNHSISQLTEIIWNSFQFLKKNAKYSLFSASPV